MLLIDLCTEFPYRIRFLPPVKRVNLVGKGTKRQAGAGASALYDSDCARHRRQMKRCSCAFVGGSGPIHFHFHVIRFYIFLYSVFFLSTLSLISLLSAVLCAQFFLYAA